jgi:hypothetical protein
MVNKTPLHELVDREKQIIELRIEGFTWRQIAEQTQMSPAGALKAYNRAMIRTLKPASEELRELELDRLDTLQQTYWQPAVNGNLRAADFILRVIDKRAKILGLDAPTKIQAEVVTYDGGTNLDAEVEAIARLIDASRTVADDGAEIHTITELQDQSEQIHLEEQTGQGRTITT